VTPRILFRSAPADVRIGEGLTIAARYWAATADRWVLAAVAVALVNGLTSWLFTGSLLERSAMDRLFRAAAQGETLDPTTMPSLIAGPLAVAAVTLVAGWFLTANAIAGLRATEVTLRWVLPSGLRAFVANMLVGLTIALAVTTSILLGAVGLLVFLASLPVLIYVLVRIGFWALGIFDGATIAAGLDQSWRLTRGAVLRSIGWSLAIIPIGIVIFVAQLVMDLLLGGVARPVADAIGAGVDLAFSAFSIVVLAVLYESQRARRLPLPAPAPVARSPFDPPPPP
jgi:hypothetical protein